MTQALDNSPLGNMLNSGVWRDGILVLGVL